MDMVAPAAKLRRFDLGTCSSHWARHTGASQLERRVSPVMSKGIVDTVIGGDRDKPIGPYDSTLAVMQSGVFQKAGIIRAAVGGFPEGNPNISEAVLADVLMEKVNFGRSAGLKISIVTQFCFEAEPIVVWLRRKANRGVDHSVRWASRSRGSSR